VKQVSGSKGMIKMKPYKSSFGDKVFEIIIIVSLILFSFIVLYPIIIILSGSLSDPFALLSGKVLLWPVKLSLKMYNIVFKHPEIWNSYANTIKYTIIGTAINVFFTILGAYPLSRKDFYGRNLFMALFTFTMFFNGGMIPLYLLIKDLHLLNNMWAIILPTAISMWNLIIMRTFFQNNIPAEIQEAAAVDGANDIVFLIKIVLPLSMPIISVMTLFYGVGNWNSWFSSLLYFSSRSKYPLQMILREIIVQSSTTDMSGGVSTDQEMVGEGIKYATMVVATLPIICLYPFLQKYFVKGVMVGSIKG
jgi:putative aldouronate transport system permease protein